MANFKILLNILFLRSYCKTHTFSVLSLKHLCIHMYICLLFPQFFLTLIFFIQLWSQLFLLFCSLSYGLFFYFFPSSYLLQYFLTYSNLASSWPLLLPIILMSTAEVSYMTTQTEYFILYKSEGCKYRHIPFNAVEEGVPSWGKSH